MAPTRVRANWLVALAGTRGDGGPGHAGGRPGVAAKVAADSAERARDELRRAVSLRLIGEAPAMLDGARAGGDEQTLEQVLVAQRLAGPSAEADRALLSTLKAVPHLSKAVNTGLRIGDVAFSRDGTHVVSGASDGSLQVWDASTLQALGAASSPRRNDISTLSLSADGKTRVAGSSDGTLQLWDLVTRKPLGEAMKAHKNEAPPWSDFGVQTVAISPDGRRAASAGWDWTLKLWDTKAAKQEGKPLMEAEGFVNRAIAFNADGSRITAAGNELALRLWNADTRELLATLDLRKAFQGDDDVAGLAFSPAGTDGFAIVAGTEHKGVWLWNAKTGQRRLLEGTPSGKVTRATFSADGLRVLASTESGRVQVWMRPPASRSPHCRPGRRIAYRGGLQPGRRYPSSPGDQDGRLRLWDIAGRHSLLAVLKPGHEDERNLVFGTNGALLAVGNTAGKVELRSMEGGHVVRALPGAAARDANLVALSADGMRLVTTSMPAIRSPNATGNTPAREAGDEATLSSGAFMQLWNTETGYPIGEPVKAQHRRIFNGAAFRFDGARFVTYEQEGDTPGDYTQVDGRLQVWDANTGQAIGEPLTGHRGGIRHAAFDPQGTTLVSAGADGTLRLWDAERQLSLPAPAMLHEDVAVVAFSPDGRQIVSGADNGSVKVWNVNAGAKADVSASGKARPRLDVKFSETQIWAVAFSPDGARVFASGSDGVRLWNAHSGHLIGSLPRSAQHGPVFGLAFNPQGTMLGYTKAGFVIQWAQAAVWAELLCARLTRNMGRQAWKELVSPEIDYQVQCPSLPATP